MLSKPEQAAFASWVTGWFNLLGQVAVTTGIRCATRTAKLRRSLKSGIDSFACATFISTASELKTNFQPNEKTTIGIYAAVLTTQGAQGLGTSLVVLLTHFEARHNQHIRCATTKVSK